MNDAPDSHLEMEYEDRNGCGYDDSETVNPLGDETPMGDEEVGWPGDGSGTDDLADYNANEADDYQNE